MTNLRSVILATAQAWIVNIQTGAFPNGRTPNAVHSILPLSLGVPLQMNNTETVAALAGLLPGLHDYTAQIRDDIPIFIDERQQLVTMHVLGAGQTDIGDYKNEYIWILKTTEDGKLIEESWEFVDSDLVVKYLAGGEETR
jgi:hypothetical protein